MIYKLGDKHPIYGTCVCMGIHEGDPYRMFKDKYGVISLIPLDLLECEKRNHDKKL